MGSSLNLDRDEVVLQRQENVAHGGSLAMYANELILTNKKIICLHKNFFGGVKTTYIYPFDQIKVYNGDPQVKLGKLSNDTKCLEIFLMDGEEHFNFETNNEETIAQWINEIRKLLGCKPLSNDELGLHKKDDSLSGQLKEAKEDFKEAGREIAAAFGFNLKDKESDEGNNKEINEDYEVPEYDYELESDEIVILSYPYVYVYGEIECNTCILLLTNKRFVVEYSTGIIKNQTHIKTFDLCGIKTYKGVPQIKCGKYQDEPVLDVFFADAHLSFSFEEVGKEKKQITCINKWVHKANEAITELKQKEEPDDSQNSHANLDIDADDIEDLNSSCEEEATIDVKESKNINKSYICEKCGFEIEPGLKFCTECGTPVEFSVSTEVEETMPNKVINKQQSDLDKSKSEMSIEQQIELLGKLKSLVDAGVLSQEEFELKKKEIL